MPSTFHIRVTKDYLVFSAAHFITFNGNICERLHGHNYRVAAEVAGPLDENHYVVDFIAVRDVLQKIVAELDHYMLLPTGHPQIRVQASDKSVEVTFEDRRWVFPRGDCVLLPVPNTTAEKLAEYIAARLLDDLQARLGKRPGDVCVEVDECNGQIGVCRLRGE
jgi:6-pyruvoyltetrahydropterin/6-carboxytetrahydropterin synthase